MKHLWTCLASILVVLGARAQSPEPAPEFIPGLTATCKTGLMSIKVQFNQPFNGVVHAREYRTPSCMAYGNGSENLSFDINMMAAKGASDYCGVLVNDRTDERSVPLAVRVHRTLELADDKFYVITCGKTGFKNDRNETSLVSLRVLNENGKKVMNAAFGLPYTLRADISKPDVLGASCSEGGIHPPWLLYLAIALGVMFLIMLLINCFLCTAMTCSCARTEVLEKDPSVVEDYDPYRSWHGSQYGSRYPSSTIHSTRSVSDNSDHYAIVQSRPGSRHSGVHRARH